MMPFFNRLQTRLNVIFVLLAVVPLVIVSIVISQRSVDSLRQNAYAYLQNQTAQVAGEINAFINQRTTTLQYVTEVSGISDEEQTGLINGLLGFDTAFQEITILDADGMEIERVSRTALVLPEDYQNRAYSPEYAAIVEDGRDVYYSGVRFDDSLREPLMTIALPVYSPPGRTLDKVLVADFRFRAVWELLASLEDHHRATTYIMNTDGEVIAHQNPSIVLRSTTFTLPETTTGNMTGLEGDDVLFATDRIDIGEREYIIVAEQQVAEALSLAQDVQIISATVLMASLIAVAGLTVFVVQRIVQPIKTFSDVARQIAAGDYSERATVRGRDEFAELATAFNIMTDRVGTLVSDLEAREEKYRLLAENARDIIYRIRLVPETQFEYISPSVTALIGYTPEDHYADPQLGFNLVHPDDRHILAETSTMSPDKPLVLRWVGKDGTVIWTEQNNTPIHDENGQVVAIEGIARNITDRKKAEEALRESESRWRSLTQHSPDHVLTLDEDLNIVFVNRASPGLTVDELIGTPLYNYVAPERQSEIKALLESVLQTGEPATYETIYDTPDGTLSYETVAAPRLNDGRIIGLTTSSRDITDRRRAEQQLREAEERYRTVADFSADWTYWEKPNGFMQYVSPACQQVIGYAPEEIQEHPELIRECVIDADRHIWDAHRHATITDKAPRRIQFRVHHKNGGIRWIEHTCRPVIDHDGTFDGYRVSNADITERKQAEEALRDARERYKTLSDLAFEGIVLHRNGVVADANPAFVRMFGYDLDELLGQQAIDVLFTPESQAKIRKSIQKAVSTPYEVVGIRKDGTHFPVEIEARQLSEELRVASLHDITKRKETASIALENERLKARFKKEQEQNALIQRIISALSHDLRTPLTVIASSKDMLSNYLDRMTPEKRQEKLDTIDRQIQFALSLLEDTVLIARGNLNEREFQPVPINLDVLCRVSVDEISQTDDENHQLVFNNLTDVGVAYVDEILVSRILLNLLTNAIKYSPPESEICLELSCIDNQVVVLRVIDQGMGISKDDLVRIFDPFYRTSNVKSLSGTGLGLSIVYDCAKRHRGRINVESTLGEGTTFTVELPTNSRSLIDD